MVAAAASAAATAGQGAVDLFPHITDDNAEEFVNGFQDVLTLLTRLRAIVGHMDPSTREGKIIRMLPGAPAKLLDELGKSQQDVASMLDTMYSEAMQAARAAHDCRQHLLNLRAGAGLAKMRSNYIDAVVFNPELPLSKKRKRPAPPAAAAAAVGSNDGK